LAEKDQYVERDQVLKCKRSNFPFYYYTGDELDYVESL